MGRFKARRGGRKAHQDPAEAAGDPVRDDRTNRPPEIFLRKCTFDEALRRLDQQVRAHAAHGHREVLVVHGRGLGSPQGQGVLGDAVRQWCVAHPQLVNGWRPAQPSWGGDGAVVLDLNAGKDERR